MAVHRACTQPIQGILSQKSEPKLAGNGLSTPECMHTVLKQTLCQVCMFLQMAKSLPETVISLMPILMWPVQSLSLISVRHHLRLIRLTQEVPECLAGWMLLKIDSSSLDLQLCNVELIQLANCLNFCHCLMSLQYQTSSLNINIVLQCNCCELEVAWRTCRRCLTWFPRDFCNEIRLVSTLCIKTSGIVMSGIASKVDWLCNNADRHFQDTYHRVPCVLQCRDCCSSVTRGSQNHFNIRFASECGSHLVENSSWTMPNNLCDKSLCQHRK